ncbi:hypothetical protein, partial [Halapricum sp. CBA1109]|uniref:hypothetical protein n=1 Tax=Halapricum sp. CBA1109 TaxID=2668068 RepID=UPI001E5D3EFC
SGGRKTASSGKLKRAKASSGNPGEASTGPSEAREAHSEPRDRNWLRAFEEDTAVQTSPLNTTARRTER